MLSFLNILAVKKPYICLIGLAAFFYGFPFVAQGQYSEIGFSLGVTHYSGDLVRQIQPATIRPGGSVFYRYNISEPLSVRAALTGGLVSGDDSRPVDAFAERRDAAFETFLLEGHAALEYHFLDFRSESAIADFSPYFFLGLGAFYFSGQENPYETYSRLQPVLPIGFGIKYIISPRILLGAELGARKTFTDYLDNISRGDLSDKNYQYGNWYDNDWYYYLGFSFNYAFYDIPCPYKWK